MNLTGFQIRIVTELFSEWSPPKDCLIGEGSDLKIVSVASLEMREAVVDGAVLWWWVAIINIF